jgi:DNA-binding MurR/RpiR family transcriptional regulator
MTTVNSLSAARTRGAMTVGISNYRGSPLARASDVFFCLSFPESRVRAGALSSRVSQVCLIDALYLLVARQMEQTATPQEVDEMVESQFRLHKPAPRSKRRSRQEQAQR